MSLINTNTQAITAARSLNRTHELLGRSLNRLSSGSKIVNPSDDAAGLAVSEKLDAQNRRVHAAGTNVQNAASYVQAADGFMGGMTKVLWRMSELGVLARDPTKNETDVQLYREEFRSLQDQLRATIGGDVAEIGGLTGVPNPLGAFNGANLFGPNAAGITVTIGMAAGQDMTIGETNLRTGTMRELIRQDDGGRYAVAADQPAVLATIEAALQQVGDERANLGAAQSRLELAATTLQVESQNLSSAISRIRDVDVARESTEFAKYNILVQSGTAMLAQANQTPQTVLKLLQAG